MAMADRQIESEVLNTEVIDETTCEGGPSIG